MTAKDVIAKAKKNGIKMFDFKFMDFIGSWQHFSVPVNSVSEDVFEEGIGFDGSSLRGWAEIHRSDMIVIPEAKSFKIDPFVKIPTASFICNVFVPATMEPYSRDPRYIAKKAENYLKQTKLGDTCYIGPEAEFFIFDNIRFSQDNHKAMYEIDSNEGPWNTSCNNKKNLGYKPRTKEGYFPVPPVDSLNDIRNEMVEELENLGLTVEAQHHEVASAGQSEIDLKYDSLLNMADSLMYFKYVVKNVAFRNEKTATFMPKPIYGDNGSGMHVNLSIFKEGKNIFAGNEYAGISKNALYFIGGLIKHASSLIAITNPTTNSFKRLVPGFEAPCNLAYSFGNRSAAIRIPGANKSSKSKRIEFRPPDPSCNPYLAFSAILMAGLDGIDNKIMPGDPLEKNIYGLTKEELRDVPSTPKSLSDALDALEKDHEYLLKGDVFTKDIIETWISYKREREFTEVYSRPTPYEFLLYYDI